MFERLVKRRFVHRAGKSVDLFLEGMSPGVLPLLFSQGIVLVAASLMVKDPGIFLCWKDAADVFCNEH